MGLFFFFFFTWFYIYLKEQSIPFYILTYIHPYFNVVCILHIIFISQKCNYMVCIFAGR